MTIRTILVDDETLAIQGLELRLQAHDDVEIIDKCANGREAIRSIKTHKPDLVFLDIQMPGFDGFSVVQGLMEVEPPLFVFVTAYSDHALARVRGAGGRLSDEAGRGIAARRHARPRAPAADREARRRGSREDTRKCSPRSRPRRPTRSPTAATAIRRTASKSSSTSRIAARSSASTSTRSSVIDAAGDYMCIKTGDNTLILRETMKDLEKRLDPRRFQRVHRSTIVNLDLVRQVKPHTNGECFLVLDSGGQVKVSRSLSRRGGALRSLMRGRARPPEMSLLTSGTNWQHAPSFGRSHVRLRNLRRAPRPRRPADHLQLLGPGQRRGDRQGGREGDRDGQLSARPNRSGFGDGEEVPLDLVFDNARRIMGVVDVPVSIDFESGYARDAGGDHAEPRRRSPRPARSAAISRIR